MPDEGGGSSPTMNAQEETMSEREAVALVISEARSDGDSLLAAVRNGEDPGTGRMRRLISALAVIFHSLGGRGEIDRRLASALFTPGPNGSFKISSFAKRGAGLGQGF